MPATKISIDLGAAHYQWGQHADGWHLLRKPDLSVIEERMPPGTFETLHYHERAQQFFYILSGSAEFTSGDETILLGPGEGMHVPPRTNHCIRNTSSADLRFLVISQPLAHGDRINC